MPCLLTWWKQLHCKNFLPPSQPACPRPVFYRIKYRLEKEIFRKWLVRIWGAITMEMGNEQTWERNPRKGEDTLDVKNVNVATDARIMEKHWENLNSYATARTDLVKLHLLLLHLQLTSSLLRMSQFLESKKSKKLIFQLKATSIWAAVTCTRRTFGPKALFLFLIWKILTWKLKTFSSEF